MKTQSSRSLRCRRHASAMIAVLMVLALISAFSVATAQRMYSLKRDLKLIEQKQMLKFRPPPGLTNRVELSPKPEAKAETGLRAP
ncbi:MAG: hypothetical protein JNN07_25620 [Verrucomicrobiales bacterium]|nr:hypothetical protein [Verrucomicrobiales bacterium]